MARFTLFFFFCGFTKIDIRHRFGSLRALLLTLEDAACARDKECKKKRKRADKSAAHSNSPVTLIASASFGAAILTSHDINRRSDQYDDDKNGSSAKSTLAGSSSRAWFWFRAAVRRSDCDGPMRLVVARGAVRGRSTRAHKFEHRHDRRAAPAREAKKEKKKKATRLRSAFGWHRKVQLTRLLIDSSSHAMCVPTCRAFHYCRSTELRPRYFQA